MIRAYIVTLLFFIYPVHLNAEAIQSEKLTFQLDRIAKLEKPWGMTFLPSGDMLVTQKSGTLHIIRDGRLLKKTVKGLPVIKENWQGGLLDVAIDPDFANNRLIYLSYVAKDKDGYGTEVLRGRLSKDKLKDVEVIFKALPKQGGGRHFGSRLIFDNDGYLYISLGDRGHRPNGQDLTTHAGSLIRINSDGSIPSNNPFVKASGVRPEIYTYGNRNIQGMTLHPDTGEVWTHEHGPQGGDEVNLMKAGKNYGWAEITYGVNYGIGTKIGDGTEREDVTPPIHYWIPSIAPSGMTFYDGDLFPEWKNNLFVGSLKFRQLVRLTLEKNKVVAEERIDLRKYGRVRDVRQGPDGRLYFLAGGGKGGVFRMSPKKSD